MKHQYLDIDADPAESQYLIACGIRAGLDHSYYQTVRAEKQLRVAESDKNHAAALYLAAESKEADASRVFLAGALMLALSLAVFVATACMIGGES